METFIHLIQLIFSLIDVTAGYITPTKGSTEIEKDEEVSLDVASQCSTIVENLKWREKCAFSACVDMISFKSEVHQATVIAISLQSVILHVGIS